MGFPHLQRRLLTTLKQQSRENVGAAYAYAHKHLSRLHRGKGGDYAINGCQVALVIREMTDDPSLLAVAVLHDLLLHPDGERLLRQSPLSRKERILVRKMHALRHLHLDTDMDALDSTLHAFIDEPRLLPLRMAHRLNDVRDIAYLPFKLRKRVARETLSMYAAIASRFGMNAWRREMEDLCFRFLYPKQVAWLEGLMQGMHKRDWQDMHQAKQLLQHALRQVGISAVITYKTRCLYTAYCTMQRTHRTLDQLHDRLNILVLVDETAHCYTALGIIHQLFHPMPGALVDHISNPRDSGYRSIDTDVYPLVHVSTQPISISVRTHAMHGECEYGIGRGAQTLHTRNTWLDLLHYLRQRGKELGSLNEFAVLLRGRIADGITLYDEKNNPYKLQAPLHAIDFVCHVHGAKTKHLQSIDRNGLPCGLSAVLNDGDTITAAFSPLSRPMKDWLKACRHQSSKALIRRMFAGL